MAAIAAATLASGALIARTATSGRPAECALCVLLALVGMAELALGAAAP